MQLGRETLQLAQNLADAAEATVVADVMATLHADVGTPRVPYLALAAEITVAARAD